MFNRFLGIAFLIQGLSWPVLSFSSTLSEHRKHYKSFKQAQRSTKRFYGSFVPQKDKRYAKINQVSQEVYKALYDVLSPHISSPFPKIPIVALSDQYENSHNHGVELAGKGAAANLIILSQKHFDPKKNKALYALLTHEAVHWILNQPNRTRPEDIRSLIYLKGLPCISCTSTESWIHHGNAQLRLEKLFLNIQKIGSFYQDPPDIPFDFYSEINYYPEKLKRLLKKANFVNASNYTRTPNCINAQIDHSKLTKLAKSFCKNKDLNCSIKKAPGVDELQSKFHQSAIACFEKLDGGNAYLELMDEYNKSKIRVTSELEDLTISPSVLRFLTYEDEADIITVIILEHLEMGTKPLEDFIIDNYMSITEWNKCREEIRFGKEPYFGLLSNIYHTNCWRIWKSRKFSKELRNPEIKNHLIKNIILRNSKN